MSYALVPAILAGGTGTRLWPLSREMFPKQFIALTDANSLLQNTAMRAAKLSHVAPPLALCGEDQRFLVGEQLRALGLSGATTLIEPAGRNTAPAAACAALWAQRQYGTEALVFLMAADHVIADQTAFAAAVSTAVQVAQSGRIVTFGITPTRPETGYGYLRAGEAMAEGGLHLAQFVEKPSRERATEFVAAGNYFWNSGMFLFRADTFLQEMQIFEPAMLAFCQQAIDGAKGDLDFLRLEPNSFKSCRNDSIDYAIMEKTTRAALVPMDAGWDDVGAWTYLDNGEKDAQGNAARGDVLLENSRNNLVYSSRRLVALAGVEDHIVVETADAVLVTNRAHAQDVKKIVARLKAEGRSEAVTHPVVYRPWGSYETIAMDERFQVKRIVVKPGQKLSLQMHHHRAEHWIVVKGTAEITVGEKVVLLTENQSTYIPLGEKHRLVNPGKIALELIEVQSGGYLGEDDIVRFDDVYGRAPAGGKA